MWVKALTLTHAFKFRGEMKTLRFFLITVLALAVVSCGFHLKGQYYLPANLKQLYLSSEKSYSPLTEQLALRLEQSQAVLLSKRNESSAELRVLPERFQRKTLSLFPNGQVAEYELIYEVRYLVIQPGKEPTQYGFELSREFEDDPNASLAKERERSLILEELRTIASERILSQLIMLQ